MTRHFFAILLIVLLGLTACGQTGDLYWPDDEQVEVDDEGDETKQQN